MTDPSAMGNRGVVSSREGGSLNDNVVASDAEDDTADRVPQPETEKVYVEVTVLAEKVGTKEDGTIKLKPLVVSYSYITSTSVISVLLHETEGAARGRSPRSSVNNTDITRVLVI